MKFNISINQKALSKLEPGATIVDGAMLDFIYWFCSSPSEDIESARMTGPDGGRYTWVNYTWVLDEMPLLKGKSKSSLSRLFERLEGLGFIKTMMFKAEDGGDRKYIKLLPKIDGLFRKRNDPVAKAKRPRCENATNHSTKDNSTKIIKDIAPTSGADIAKVINLFKDISPNSYQKWFGSPPQRKSSARLLQKYKLDDLERLITKIIPQLNTMPYMPKDSKAFSPWELDKNLDKIIAKIKELGIKKSQDKLNVTIIS